MIQYEEAKIGKIINQLKTLKEYIKDEPEQHPIQVHEALDTLIKLLKNESDKDTSNQSVSDRQNAS